MRSRLLPRLMLLAGLLLALSPLGPTPSSATSCMAPELQLERGQVLGPELEIHGRFFTRGCPMPQPCQAGCSGDCVKEAPAPRPIQDAGLRLEQRGRVWFLTTADASEDGDITFTTTLPPGAKPGRAVLSSSGSSRFVVRVAP